MPALNEHKGEELEPINRAAFERQLKKSIQEVREGRTIEASNVEGLEWLESDASASRKKG